MQKNNNIFIKNNESFEKYSLELMALANNLDDNKRLSPKHIISYNKCESYMPFLESRLKAENTVFDDMGDGDLINYEKWLKWMFDDFKRGELYYADLSPVVGSEQGGVRPVLIIQNNVGNKYSPTVIVAAITSQINKAKLPTHIELNTDYGLQKNSVVLLEQLRTLDKRRLKEKIGIKKTIKDYGIDEKDFLDRLDEMSEQAFDDQCTGANPRYPLMKELKE